MTVLTLFFTNLLLQSLYFFFFFNDPAPPEIYTLPLHAALPISAIRRALPFRQPIVTWAENQLIIAEASCSPNVTTNPPSTTCTNAAGIPAALTALNAVRTADRKSTRLNSSHSQISYAVFCLKKK